MAAQPKATWTPADEELFAAMKTRRDEVVGKREEALHRAAVEVWADTVNTGPDALQHADRVKCVAALADALRFRVDTVRDALAPFDSGVRAAAPETAA
jgi:hypothetical protein